MPDSNACVVYSTEGIDRHRGSVVELGAHVDELNASCSTLLRLQERASHSKDFFDLDFYASGIGFRAQVRVFACSPDAVRKAAKQLAKLLRQHLKARVISSELKSRKDVERALA